MRWHARIFAALAALTLLAAPAYCQTNTPPPDGQPEGVGQQLILVLVSGEVIEGKISLVDGRYLVVLPSGKIFVPAGNVELVCKDLDEAYQLRRSRISHGQAQDHAELAQWCQRRGLDARAEEELAIARQLDPKHPIIGLVERRLAASRMPMEPNGPGGADQSLASPTPQQLEDLAAGLPPGSVEAFTRVVQPLLLNRCATAGCHTDRSDNEFRLERSRPGVPLGRTSTHRNLLATLKLIDSTSPDQCELLRPRKCPNRLQTEATLSLSQSSQYRFLVAWVTLMAQQSPVAGPQSSVASAATASLPPATIHDGRPETVSPQLAQTTTDETPPNWATKASLAAATPQTEPQEVPPPAPFQQPTSADPFDPAVFNRRYGTTAPAAAPPPAKEKIPLPSQDFAR